MGMRGAALVVLSSVAVCSAASAAAQGLPSEPIALAGGRVVISGDVSATAGSDDPGFFNYTDYEHSALRALRVDLSAAVKAGSHLALLGELRTENTDSIVPYALYARIRPWTDRNFDIQVGRVPPTFGAFARRTYANDNLLIGYPLAYQYLTSLRPDSLPANADELMRKRSLGWLLRYTIGNTTLDRGVPLVSAFRWDTGVQVHGGSMSGAVTGTVSVTTGTVSNPRVRDDNSRPQVAGRLELRPTSSVILGTSVARGPFVSTAAARAASAEADGDDFTQTAWGGDVEFSGGYYLLRLESIVSAWRLPIVREPAIRLPLRAVSTSVEGRYKITTGIYAAARFDHLAFSDIVTTQTTAPWEAPVTRVEVGAGYSIQRNLILKASYQQATRDGGVLARRGRFGATQVVFWF